MNVKITRERRRSSETILVSYPEFDPTPQRKDELCRPTPRPFDHERTKTAKRMVYRPKIIRRTPRSLDPKENGDPEINCDKVVGPRMGSGTGVPTGGRT